MTERAKRKVWIVLNGEMHEGGAVVSVHDSKIKAMSAALKVETHFSGGWQPLPDPDSWGNGCDYVTVEEWEIL
jgi:hypothetical protein